MITVESPVDSFIKMEELEAVVPTRCPSAETAEMAETTETAEIAEAETNSCPSAEPEMSVDELD